MDTPTIPLAHGQKERTPQPLLGRVALVTGASSGIGAATARELARRGARVALAARRDDALEAQVRAIQGAGGEAIAIPTDVSDPAQLSALVRQVIAAYGQIDILVNNAGIGNSKPIAQSSPDALMRMLDVNLAAPVLLTREVLPGMLERRQGTLIFVASVAGHIAISPLYAAAKFGVRGFARALRRQLAGTGVAVSVVSPGFIRTEMTHNLRAPIPGPEVVARTIADLAMHPKREVVIPRVYWLGIWVERLLPGLIDLVARPAARKM